MRRQHVLAAVLYAGCAMEETVGDLDEAITGASAIGSPTWSAWLGNCTASVLNERWLLTGGSCVTAGLQLGFVTVPFGSDGTATVYSGLVRNYVHDRVALMYLDERGIDLAGIGKAKLYADARRPWHDSSEPSLVSWAGWGSTGSGCSTTTYKLRVADDDLIQDNVGDYWATIGRDQHRECPGDLGGQYLVTRGGENLQIAVHAGVFDFSVNGTGFRNFGALYAHNRTWIEDTIAAETSRAFQATWTSGSAAGYAYREANIVMDGFEPIGGYQYRCMDLLKDGAIGMRDCTGSDAQRWGFPASGAILAYEGPLIRNRRCLAIDSTAIGAKLHLKPCDETGYQRFAYTQDGRLRSAMASTRCLQAQGANQAVVVAACQTNLAQQMWSTSPIPPP